MSGDTDHQHFSDTRHPVLGGDRAQGVAPPPHEARRRPFDGAPALVEHQGLSTQLGVELGQTRNIRAFDVRADECRAGCRAQVDTGEESWQRARAEPESHLITVCISAQLQTGKPTAGACELLGNRVNERLELELPPVVTWRAIERVDDAALKAFEVCGKHAHLGNALAFAHTKRIGDEQLFHA